MDAAFEAGSGHFQSQLQAAIKGCVLDNEYGDRLVELLGEDGTLFQQAFLWGWYYEFAKQSGDWPTSPSARASFHLANHLVRGNGYNFKEAREVSASIDQMWNAADPLAEAIFSYGERSFHEPDHTWLLHVLREIARAEREDSGGDPPVNLG